MFISKLKVMWRHGWQAIPNLEVVQLPAPFRGRPLITSKRLNATTLAAAIEACPTGALIGNPLSIDLGRCLFCGECERMLPGNVEFTQNWRMASTTREGLIVNEGEEVWGDAVAKVGAKVDAKVDAKVGAKVGAEFGKDAGAKIDAKVGAELGVDAGADAEAVVAAVVAAEVEKQTNLFRRSLKLRQVCAGGDGSAELELGAAGNVNFDMRRLGIEFTASPRHADGVVFTGPITRAMAAPLEATFAAVPRPRVLIAVGADAISGGLFEHSDAIDRSFLDRHTPDLYVPGNPPHPLTFIDGIAKLRQIPTANAAQATIE